jgi:hypothetical protein
VRAVPCPISPEDLRRLYVGERLTDEAIVERIGEGATLKRVRSWRQRFGIETIRRVDRADVPAIEGKLRSLLIGSMLGDGRLSKTVNASRYMENHADDQKDYLAWKVAQWGSWVKEDMKPVCWHRPEGNFNGWRFHTLSHPSLNEWHALFYDAVGPKRLDRRVVDLVDDFAMAIWFMDDGSTGWWPRITFGMDATSQGIAMAILDRHGFNPRWEIHKGNTGTFHFEGEDQAHRFIALVEGHIPECMRRKLTFGFQGPHYQVRQTLTPELLRDMAARGVPIKRMAKDLGQSHTTIDRYLKEFGIEHPRKVGRPKGLRHF